MNARTTPIVEVHTSPLDVPSIPPWFAEVVLQAILDAYPHRNILLLWDKAPWHRGPAIGDLLAVNPRLTLLTFPTAAPDLNPQEHGWRATRRAVAHNHTHR